MAPNTMTEAGTTQAVEGEDQTPQLAKAITVNGRYAKAIRIRTGGKSAHSGAAKMRRALTDAFKKVIDQKETQYQVKSVTELSHSEYMERWKRFDDRSQRALAELHKVFLGINKKQKEEVIENLPKATGKKKIKLGELFDPKEWIGITIDLATPILTSLAKDEATAALAMIGAQHQDILADKSTRAALDRGISKMAKSYTETTLQQLKDVLGEKLTQEGGTNLTELTDTVDGVYSFADERRAGLIAEARSQKPDASLNLSVVREQLPRSGIQMSAWRTPARLPCMSVATLSPASCSTIKSKASSACMKQFLLGCPRISAMICAQLVSYNRLSSSQVSSLSPVNFWSSRAIALNCASSTFHRR
jgi:hypothetical protein